MDGQGFIEFLTFRKVIAPIVLQVLFWIDITMAVVGGLYLISRGGYAVIVGLVCLILSPIIIRVFFEAAIVFFRMYQAIKEINDKTGMGGAFALAPGVSGAPGGGQVGSPALSRKTCQSCGATVDASLRFCNKCGQPVS